MEKKLCVDADIIDTWLNKVIYWTSGKRSGCPTLDDLGDLKCILSAVYKKLDEINDMGQTFTLFPNIGQFLGRLCGLHIVLANEHLYELLMKCVLKFHVDQPSSVLEKKSKQWAVSQVRSTASVCGVSISDKCFVIEKTGDCIGSICDVQVEQVLSRVVDSLPVLQRRWDAYKNCYIVPEAPKPIPQIRKLTTLCLHICHNEAEHNQCCNPNSECAVNQHNQMHMDRKMMTFFERILQHLRYVEYGKQHQVDKFLSDITDMDMQNAYLLTKCEGVHQGCLSPKARILIWLQYLQSLEKEVLQLVDSYFSILATCGYIPTYKLEKLLRCRGLVQAMVTHKQIADVVNAMLEKLITDLNNDTNLVRLWSRMHHCVITEMSVGVCNGWVSTSPGLGIGRLVRLLDANPNEMTRTIQEEHLQRIWSSTNSLLQQSVPMKNIFSLLLQCSYWFSVSLHLCLVGSKRILQSCFTYIYWHIDLNTDQPHFQEQFETTVQALRCLLQKSSLQDCDISCAMPVNIESDVQLQRVLQQLLCMFLVYAQSGKSVESYILQWVTKSGPVKKLESLLCAADNISTACKIELLNETARSNLIFCLQKYASEAHMENSSDENKAVFLSWVKKYVNLLNCSQCRD